MSTEYEVRIDGGKTLLVGDVSIQDASFGHAFGTESAFCIDVSNFKVYTCIDGRFEDVTEALHYKRLEPLQEKFEEHVLKEIQLERLEGIR